MKNHYNDHADYLEEVYQDSLDTDTCPACGGVGRIPDEGCIGDCECELCLGEGIVNETVRRNYLKDKKNDYDRD